MCAPVSRTKRSDTTSATAATAAAAATSTSRGAKAAASQPLNPAAAGGNSAPQPAAQPRRDSDAAVAGGFVEAESESAPARSDEVDLHDDGHRPRESLVDAQQGVGRNDPSPARRDRDHHRDRDRERPAED